MTADEDREPADRLLDAIVPEELDWEPMVRSYPIAALGVAAAGGFYLGFAHGAKILGAAAAMASTRATEVADRLAEAVEGGF